MHAPELNDGWKQKSQYKIVKSTTNTGSAYPKTHRPLINSFTNSYNILHLNSTVGM